MAAWYGLGQAEAIPPPPRTNPAYAKIHRRKSTRGGADGERRTNPQEVAPRTAGTHASRGTTPEVPPNCRTYIKCTRKGHGETEARASEEESVD
jgi:hypothetical protein